MKCDRKRVKEVFENFVKTYDMSDPRILLKYNHTLRVAEVSYKIAQGISNVDCELAWIIGILHDVGRFYQIREFGTFADEKSIDHANAGADMLFKDGLIKEYLLNTDYNDKELAIIESSIRNHSRYKIEDGLEAEMIEYCKILRDADKIDIFQADCEVGLENVFCVSIKELKDSDVSDYVKQCFEKRITVLNSRKRTPIDCLVAHICLIFDFYYSISSIIVKEQGYLNELLNFSSSNEETRLWFNHMKNVVMQIL